MSQTTVTALLGRWQNGEDGARDRILELLYDELHRLARRQMKGERRDHTLQPTALVNEAYLRLADVEMSWQNRAQFLAMAARTMRRILVEHARSKLRIKRGERPIRVELDEQRLVDDRFPKDVLALHEALEALSEHAERAGKVVELHYFGGLQQDEIAEALGTSTATVGRDLRAAKAWLRRQMSRGQATRPPTDGSRRDRD